MLWHKLGVWRHWKSDWEEEIKEEDQEQEHVVTIPLNNNDTFTCDECGKSKETLKQLIDHKLSHKRIICEKCDKTISYINRLKHANRCKGILHCDEEDCIFQTKYKEIMSKHKRKHQRHLCKDCGHFTKTVSKLKKHKEMNTKLEIQLSSSAIFVILNQHTNLTEIHIQRYSFILLWQHLLEGDTATATASSY